jgi:hypothetical protein
MQQGLWPRVEARRVVSSAMILAFSVSPMSLMMSLCSAIPSLKINQDGFAAIWWRRGLAGNSEVVLGRKLYLAGGIRGIGKAEDWRCERAYIILVIRMVEGIESVNGKFQLRDTGLRFRTKSR